MSSTSVQSWDRSSHLHQSFFSFFFLSDYKGCSFYGGGVDVGRSTYLNAVAKVVEDIGSKQEIFSSDDRIRQGQVHKERLEGCQGGRHRHTKSSQLFHTEGTGLPFGDGVRDGV